MSINDFLECINSAGKASVMATKDFFDFRNQSSSGKDTNFLKLAEISEVQFRKGETKCFEKHCSGNLNFRICRNQIPTKEVLLSMLKRNSV